MNKEKNKKEVSILISTNYHKLNYLIKALGEDEIKSIMVPDQIRLELLFDNSKEPHVIFQLIKGYIDSLITKHPNKVHRDLITTALKKNKISYDDSVIDITSRELIKRVRILHSKLKTPCHLQTLINNKKENIETFSKESGRQPLSLKINRFASSLNLESEFEKDGTFIWDQALIETIKGTGEYGKQSATKVADLLKKIVKKYQKEKKVILVHWFNIHSPTQEDPFYIAQALQTLVLCIYKDIIEKKVNFAAKNPPGTTSNVSDAIVKILEPGKTTNRCEDCTQIHDRKNNLIATIDANIMEQLSSKELSETESITAVRLLRYFIKLTHDKFTKNHDHWYDHKFPGGYKQIAKEMGLKSKKYIPHISKLLWLFDTIKFNLPGIRSRLINISECRPGSKYSHKGGIIITTQPPLRPYHIFNDKGSFIIPLLKNTPLVGHSKYHARLHTLQFKITNLFSNKSSDLASNKCIHILEEQWNEWFHDLGIPNGRNGLHLKIRNSITGPKGYLEAVGKDTYTLKNEDKALSFFTEQGKIRIRASKAGKKSAQKKGYNTSTCKFRKG